MENFFIDDSVTIINFSKNSLIYMTVSVFRVLLVRIFQHLDWIQRKSPYSARIREITDQKSSEYGHFLRRVKDVKQSLWLIIKLKLLFCGKYNIFFFFFFFLSENFKVMYCSVENFLLRISTVNVTLSVVSYGIKQIY